MLVNDAGTAKWWFLLSLPVWVFLIATLWPATWWFEVSKYEIIGGTPDETEVVYDGVVRHQFPGSYQHSIRTSGGEVFCNTEPVVLTYRPGGKRPDPITLDWWFDGDQKCLPRLKATPGRYFITTVWTHNVSFAPKFTVATTNVFEIEPR